MADLAVAGIMLVPAFVIHTLWTKLADVVVSTV